MTWTSFTDVEACKQDEGYQAAKLLSEKQQELEERSSWKHPLGLLRKVYDKGGIALFGARRSKANGAGRSWKQSLILAKACSCCLVCCISLGHPKCLQSLLGYAVHREGY